MIIKFELTLDEFKSIKTMGSTVLNGYCFIKLGSEELQKKIIKDLEKGLEHTAFLLQKKFMDNEDGYRASDTNLEVIQVEIVKRHAERVLPSPKFLSQKLQEHGMDIKHPICPISMYFEGDEDKCDLSKCDWDQDTRSCTEACNKT